MSRPQSGWCPAPTVNSENTNGAEAFSERLGTIVQLPRHPRASEIAAQKLSHAAEIEANEIMKLLTIDKQSQTGTQLPNLLSLFGNSEAAVERFRHVFVRNYVRQRSKHIAPPHGINPRAVYTAVLFDVSKLDVVLAHFMAGPWSTMILLVVATTDAIPTGLANALHRYNQYAKFVAKKRDTTEPIPKTALVLYQQDAESLFDTHDRSLISNSLKVNFGIGLRDALGRSAVVAFATKKPVLGPLKQRIFSAIWKTLAHESPVMVFFNDHEDRPFQYPLSETQMGTSMLTAFHNRALIPLAVEQSKIHNLRELYLWPTPDGTFPWKHLQNVRLPEWQRGMLAINKDGKTNHMLPLWGASTNPALMQNLSGFNDMWGAFGQLTPMACTLLYRMALNPYHRLLTVNDVCCRLGSQFVASHPIPSDRIREVLDLVADVEYAQKRAADQIILSRTENLAMSYPVQQGMLKWESDKGEDDERSYAVSEVNRTFLELLYSTRPPEREKVLTLWNQLFPESAPEAVVYVNPFTETIRATERFLGILSVVVSSVDSDDLRPKVIVIANSRPWPDEIPPALLEHYSLDADNKYEMRGSGSRVQTFVPFAYCMDTDSALERLTLPPTRWALFVLKNSEQEFRTAIARMASGKKKKKKKTDKPKENRHEKKQKKPKKPSGPMADLVPEISTEETPAAANDAPLTITAPAGTKSKKKKAPVAPPSLSVEPATEAEIAAWRLPVPSGKAYFQWARTVVLMLNSDAASNDYEAAWSIMRLPLAPEAQTALAKLFSEINERDGTRLPTEELVVGDAILFFGRILPGSVFSAVDDTTRIPDLSCQVNVTRRLTTSADLLVGTAAAKTLAKTVELIWPDQLAKLLINMWKDPATNWNGTSGGGNLIVWSRVLALPERMKTFVPRTGGGGQSQPEMGPVVVTTTTTTTTTAMTIDTEDERTTITMREEPPKSPDSQMQTPRQAWPPSPSSETPDSAYDTPDRVLAESTNLHRPDPQRTPVLVSTSSSSSPALAFVPSAWISSPAEEIPQQPHMWDSPYLKSLLAIPPMIESVTQRRVLGTNTMAQLGTMTSAMTVTIAQNRLPARMLFEFIENTIFPTMNAVLANNGPEGTEDVTVGTIRCLYELVDTLVTTWTRMRVQEAKKLSDANGLFNDLTFLASTVGKLAARQWEYNYQIMIPFNRAGLPTPDFLSNDLDPLYFPSPEDPRNPACALIDIERNKAIAICSGPLVPIARAFAIRKRNPLVSMLPLPGTTYAIVSPYYTYHPGRLEDTLDRNVRLNCGMMIRQTLLPEEHHNCKYVAVYTSSDLLSPEIYVVTDRDVAADEELVVSPFYMHVTKNLWDMLDEAAEAIPGVIPRRISKHHLHEHVSPYRTPIAGREPRELQFTKRVKVILTPRRLSFATASPEQHAENAGGISSSEIATAQDVIRNLGALSDVIPISRCEFLSIGNGLRVSKSSIENAGRGVFATRAITKGQSVCFYFGRAVSGTAARDFYENPDNDASYVIELTNQGEGSPPRYIDAGGVPPLPGISPGFMINEAPSRAERNIEFLDSQTEPWRITIVATRDINPGDELFGDYSAAYDRSHYGVHEIVEESFPPLEHHEIPPTPESVQMTDSAKQRKRQRIGASPNEPIMYPPSIPSSKEVIFIPDEEIREAAAFLSEPVHAEPFIRLPTTAFESRTIDEPSSPYAAQRTMPPAAEIVMVVNDDDDDSAETMEQLELEYSMSASSDRGYLSVTPSLGVGKKRRATESPSPVAEITTVVSERKRHKRPRRADRSVPSTPRVFVTSTDTENTDASSASVLDMPVVENIQTAAERTPDSRSIRMVVSPKYASIPGNQATIIRLNMAEYMVRCVEKALDRLGSNDPTLADRWPDIRDRLRKSARIAIRIPDKRNYESIEQRNAARMNDLRRLEEALSPTVVNLTFEKRLQWMTVLVGRWLLEDMKELKTDVDQVGASVKKLQQSASWKESINLFDDINRRLADPFPPKESTDAVPLTDIGDVHVYHPGDVAPTVLLMMQCNLYGYVYLRYKECLDQMHDLIADQTRSVVATYSALVDETRNAVQRNMACTQLQEMISRMHEVTNAVTEGRPFAEHLVSALGNDLLATEATRSIRWLEGTLERLQSKVPTAIRAAMRKLKPRTRARKQTDVDLAQEMQNNGILDIMTVDLATTASTKTAGQSEQHEKTQKKKRPKKTRSPPRTDESGPSEPAPADVPPPPSSPEADATPFEIIYERWKQSPDLDYTFAKLTYCIISTDDDGDFLFDTMKLRLLGLYDDVIDEDERLPAGEDGTPLVTLFKSFNSQLELRNVLLQALNITVTKAMVIQSEVDAETDAFSKFMTAVRRYFTDSFGIQNGFISHTDRVHSGGTYSTETEFAAKMDPAKASILEPEMREAFNTHLHAFLTKHCDVQNRLHSFKTAEEFSTYITTSAVAHLERAYIMWIDEYFSRKISESVVRIALLNLEMDGWCDDDAPWLKQLLLAAFERLPDRSTMEKTQLCKDSESEILERYLEYFRGANHDAISQELIAAVQNTIETNATRERFMVVLKNLHGKDARETDLSAVHKILFHLFEIDLSVESSTGRVENVTLPVTQHVRRWISEYLMRLHVPGRNKTEADARRRIGRERLKEIVEQMASTHMPMIVDFPIRSTFPSRRADNETLTVDLKVGVTIEGIAQRNKDPTDAPETKKSTEQQTIESFLKDPDRKKATVAAFQANRAKSLRILNETIDPRDPDQYARRVEAEADLDAIYDFFGEPEPMSARRLAREYKNIAVFSESWITRTLTGTIGPVDRQRFARHLEAAIAKRFKNKTDEARELKKLMSMKNSKDVQRFKYLESCARLEYLSLLEKEHLASNIRKEEMEQLAQPDVDLEVKLDIILTEVQNYIENLVDQRTLNTHDLSKNTDRTLMLGNYINNIFPRYTESIGGQVAIVRNTELPDVTRNPSAQNAWAKMMFDHFRDMADSLRRTHDDQLRALAEMVTQLREEDIEEVQQDVKLVMKQFTRVLLDLFTNKLYTEEMIEEFEKATEEDEAATQQYGDVGAENLDSEDEREDDEEDDEENMEEQSVDEMIEQADVEISGDEDGLPSPIRPLPMATVVAVDEGTDTEGTSIFIADEGDDTATIIFQEETSIILDEDSPPALSSPAMTLSSTEPPLPAAAAVIHTPAHAVQFAQNYFDLNIINQGIVVTNIQGNTGTLALYARDHTFEKDDLIAFVGGQLVDHARAQELVRNGYGRNIVALFPGEQYVYQPTDVLDVEETGAVGMYARTRQMRGSVNTARFVLLVDDTSGGQKRSVALVAKHKIPSGSEITVDRPMPPEESMAYATVTEVEHYSL